MFPLNFNNLFLKALLLLLLLFLSLHTFAQKQGNPRELRGNGRIVTKAYPVAAFEAIEIEQFPANVAVMVTDKTPSVQVSLDENLLSQLHVTSENGILKLALKDPDDREFWVSKAAINVKISTGHLKSLLNGSNGDVMVSGLREDSFDLVNAANGSVTLEGSSKTLNLVSQANGRVDAGKFLVETARVVADANATIVLNAQQMQTASKAFAKIENLSDPRTVSGTQLEVSTHSKLVSLQFVNDSASPKQVTLISYSPGETGNETNGFMLAPFQKKEKRYPVGTKVYIASKEQAALVMSGQALTDKPFLTVQANDQGRKVKLSGQ